MHMTSRLWIMFFGVIFSISTTCCGAFRPQSKEELQIAVNRCLLKSLEGDCSNGPHGLIGTWDVSSVTSMEGMFYGAALFNGDISKWDVSSVTDMWDLFNGAASFNGDISKWDVSSVTDIGGMFAAAVTFNRDISGWDVSNVNDMTKMFNGAASFNCDISKWDVSSVTDMMYMFNGAVSFNGDISKWDVSSVKSMTGMFNGAFSFDSDISKWDVSRVGNMRYMFKRAASFNGDISKWDVSNVINMMFMFMDAISFKRELCGSSWVHSTAAQGDQMFFHSKGSISPTVCNTAVTVISYTTLTIMFEPQSVAELEKAVDTCLELSPEGDYSNGAHGPIGTWDVSSVTSMSLLFSGAKWFHGGISKWDVSSVSNMAGMFSGATAFNGEISKWDVSSVTDISYMFHGAASFNGDMSKWDVSSVTDMMYVFNGAKWFNSDMSEWDVSRVTSMAGMFKGAESFNGDISKWDVSRVRDMRYMFKGAASFNSDIFKWDVSSVTNMGSMFMDATSFNRELCGASWVHSTASKGDYMFVGSSGSILPPACTAVSTYTTSTMIFSPQSKAELKTAVKACLQLSPEGLCPNGPHGPIGMWDVSGVTDMLFMFSDATTFNGDISKWDVSSVISMAGMFSDAMWFNGHISKWDVSSVTRMNAMFVGAKFFNGDISRWDVSSVTKMNAMFGRATTFNGDISKWDVSSVTDMNYMFHKATFFNSDLSQWDVSSVKDMSGMFQDAKSFNQKLCGASWVHSTAQKDDMFTGSSGSISSTVCTVTTPIIYVNRKQAMLTTSIATTPATSVMECPKCGTFKKSGRFSCCAPGGAWHKNCGGAGNANVEHTWIEGTQACRGVTATRMSSICTKCGTIKKSGKASCCAPSGAWYKNCGNTGDAEHTWGEGFQACKITATRIASVCPKCAAIMKSGKLSCCAPGGAWFNNCGANGDSKSEHTWVEGVRACKDAVSLFSVKAEAKSI